VRRPRRILTIFKVIITFELKFQKRFKFICEQVMKWFVNIISSTLIDNSAALNILKLRTLWTLAREEGFSK
jgi:hypothetical protein